LTEPNLQNQVVVIIGAGRWPGPALALAFARHRAIVAVNDLSPILLDPLEDAAQRLPGKIKSYTVDATRGMPLRAMLDEIDEDWGKIDILINNPRIQPDRPILDMDEWDWQRTVDMNLNGPFLITKLVGRQMRELGQGVILNLVDTNPQILSSPGSSAYSASQAGLLALSETAARELIAYNIRVHTLCPDTEVLYPTDINEISAEATALSAHPGEALTRLALYLSSPAAAHLTGQTFWVNREQFTPQPKTKPME